MFTKMYGLVYLSSSLSLEGSNAGFQEFLACLSQRYAYE
jgi:hypothetical protein